MKNGFNESKLVIGILSIFLSLISSVSYSAIPAAAITDPLYAKGYLNISHYNVTVNSSGSAATNTSEINQAIQDAYNRDDNTPIVGGGTQIGSLSLYFPPGTYWVNDTLQAHTATGHPNGTADFDKPKNHLTMVGATNGAFRPLIKLAASASGFTNSGTPKNLLEFVNWGVDSLGAITVPNEPQGNQGYNQMLRGINLDCNGNAGCIALYFTNAQNSSVEDVTITATGAHTGIKGSVGPGVMVNVKVTEGNVGIDTTGIIVNGNTDPTMAGITITGLKLIKQVNHSVIHNGFHPLTISGFEIVTPDSSTRAALTIQSGYNKAYHAQIALIDGIIRLGGEPTVAAIDNTNGQNFYARNIYVTPSGSFSGNATNGKLIQSASNTTITGNGGAGNRKRIDEYNYTMPSADSTTPVARLSSNLIDGFLDTTEYSTITDSAPTPPTDIVTRHAWINLPSVDDTDAYDASAGGITPGVVNHTTLQNIIDNNPKVFLPRGIYKLTGPITLRDDTVFFGAGRGLTRIEGDPNWSSNVSCSTTVVTETPIILTDDSSTATTYIGDLNIGVDTYNEANDCFTALLWKAGASSMVHIGQVYRSSTTTPANRWTTRPHSLLKITDNGGGRWYAPGAIKTLTSEDTNGLFRILRVTSTTQPLWIYSLNLEHARGIDTFADFNNVVNARIYNIKSEYNGAVGGSNPYTVLTSVLKIRNSSQNVGVFGSGSMRNGLTNKGAVEVLYSSDVLGALISPQSDNISGVTGAKTITETYSGGPYVVDYPNVVTLFKRGTIDDSVMVHTAPSY